MSECVHRLHLHLQPPTTHLSPPTHPPSPFSGLTLNPEPNTRIDRNRNRKIPELSDGGLVRFPDLPPSAPPPFLPPSPPLTLIIANQDESISRLNAGGGWRGGGYPFQSILSCVCVCVCVCVAPATPKLVRLGAPGWCR